MKKIKYQKILVTHDGSKLSSASFPHAAALALAFNAEVILLQVLKSVEQEIASMSSAGIGVYPVDLAGGVIEMIKKNKQKVKLELERLKIQFEENGIKKVRIYVKEGLDQDVILDTAKKENVDLIVMSTHGRTGLKRAILGSVADHVIRHSHCPVFVVHPDKGGEKS